MGIWKKLLLVFVILVICAGSYAYKFFLDIAPIASGMSSQTLCTNVLMLERDQQDVIDHDLSAIQRKLTRSYIDHEKKMVTTHLQIGPFSHKNRSAYRKGLGCSVLHSANDQQFFNKIYNGEGSQEITGKTVDWPTVTRDKQGINYSLLNKAIDQAYQETALGYDQQKNTRAVLVWQGEDLIAERYTKGFTGETPLRSMSMAKSASSALVGVLALQQDIDIHAPKIFKEWSQDTDPRAALTLHHLLSMTSGHAYKEQMESDPRNVLNKMLFGVQDMTGFAVQQDIDKEPGSYWDYQTVNSVLLQKYVREQVGDDQAYYKMAHQDLFEKAGMTNTFFQADADGTFAGGALMYASPRDWMRFGLLYLNDGVYKGIRVLPKGWVEYTKTPTKASLQRRAYGAQFWLNAKSEQHWMDGVPEDAYGAQGHYGQYVIIIPSLDMVIVRLGVTFPPERFDLHSLVKDVTEAVSGTANRDYKHD
ncbi:serine hydrolase [Temperatibacter marinus]|uniref:Serine hydrolase n=1 Tax=Temperatibacter marinus TaxID=1456591 RepID=A0AA52EE10_9PROT|nr:serine hydrolase [Temperatibacter marinus]WND02985.1 serine hydrolase [Temperatibacter marinus]